MMCTVHCVVVKHAFNYNEKNTIIANIFERNIFDHNYVFVILSNAMCKKCDFLRTSYLIVYGSRKISFDNCDLLQTKKT